MSTPVALREAIRQRADYRCEYCYLPEGYSAREHQPDHIIPEKHDGQTTLENLAWACFQCNNRKSSEVAAYDKETGELTPFFNPRTQNWDDHFVLTGTLIVGKTAIGRVTVWIMSMNRPDRLETRRMLIEADLW